MNKHDLMLTITRGSKALGIMWKWTQARKTNGSRGDKKVDAKTDAQGCTNDKSSS
ncbi:hypothetical protein HanXRQr2_Chr17g0798471 [Helianthus annuus]|uniref:Uncharacterized protein n=1 Tax=Helianthus annuus TaxID=4232 RepID=A0A251RPG9_HELAN|nr:hypothetical protein HanXRQr2_Chr17g0798471 [Helianthus annuus]